MSYQNYKASNRDKEKNKRVSKESIDIHRKVEYDSLFKLR